jgi:hypothetical protein
MSNEQAAHNQERDTLRLQWWQTWPAAVGFGVLCAVPYAVLSLTTGTLGKPTTCGTAAEIARDLAYLLVLIGMGIVWRFNYLVQPGRSIRERLREAVSIFVLFPILAVVVNGRPPACIVRVLAMF